MSLKEINNINFNKMIQAASVNLKDNADFINSLNVFPVPDGDTGTNMSLSLDSGAKYVEQDTSNSVGHQSSSFAKGLLMGARGNSGVILSQIFRGFSKAIDDKKVLTTEDVTNAFMNSAETAYKSVMNPTEGTILTVIRGSAQAAKDNNSDDILELFSDIVDGANNALKKTPELLSVLKQVGVVDSGGQGLAFVLEAFNDALNGRKIQNEEKQPNNAEMDEMVDVAHHKGVQSKLDPEDIKYGYCTQVMVRIGRGREVDHKFDYQTFYDYLAKLGNSLLVVNDEEIIRVHVHTEHPGKVLAWSQEFGDLANIKIDNMRLQQEDIIKENHEEDQKEQEQTNNESSDNKKQEPKDTAIITVANGNGLSELFKSLGVTDVIQGGQTMNPSTNEIVQTIQNSNANKAIILPNNGNILLAAEQATKVIDIPSVIVHSKTISQGMASMLGYNPNDSLEDNQENMEDNLDTVKSGEITKAVRDTKIHDFNIKKDDYIGIVDGNINVTSEDKIQTTVDMVKKMLDEDSEVVTIIYGKDADQDEANQISDSIQSIDDELEIEIHNGEQPVYPFLISVE